MSINEWLGFNPQETEAAESFRGKQEPIPNGKYKAIVTAASRQHTKSGKGWFWALTFTIAEGQYEGRSVVHRFNMVNPSAEATEIGRRHMRRYLDCIGNLAPASEDDLCNIAVSIETECKKSTYNNRDGEPTEGINSEIVKIDPYSDASKLSQTEPPQTEPSKIPPWKK